MRIVVEFFRTRDADDAHAVIGREVAEATDLDDALKVAQRLFQNLNMPQRPDAMTISDATGAVLYSGVIYGKATIEGRSFL